MLSSSSAGLTARWIKPQSAASVALTLSPSSSICFARVSPTSRGSSHVGTRIRTESACRKRLPKHRVGGSHGEVGSECQIAPETDGESAHAADDRQLDAVHQFDDAMSGVRNATDEVTGARAWGVAAVGGNPVGARAEVVARAADVDSPQRVVGGGVGQCGDKRLDHAMAQRVTLRRPIEREPQHSTVAARGERAISRGGVHVLTHRRIRPFPPIRLPLQ